MGGVSISAWTALEWASELQSWVSQWIAQLNKQMNINYAEKRKLTQIQTADALNLNGFGVEQQTLKEWKLLPSLEESIQNHRKVLQCSILVRRGRG